jgi:putative pyruvate formate lyase activating enzyme
MAERWPCYLSLLESGALAERAATARAALRDCHLCGNDCGIDRTERAGPCRVAATAYVASYGPHFGEEDVLRGWRGSGTIFFSGCNLHCVYCQNYDISQALTGRPAPPETLARIMLTLEARGCHNVNLVSPSHVVPQIVQALAVAAEEGLRLPLVYNTGGYDAPQALALLDGLVDIYMPDMKYADPDVGRRLSAVADYPAVNQAAVKEMHRQVGDLVVDDRGLARRGLLVRHLVLPEGLAGTAAVARFLTDEVSPETYVNVMAQYRPAHCAGGHPPLDRSVTREAYRKVVAAMQAAGLHRFDRRV